MATVTQSRTARLKDDALRRLDRRVGKSASYWVIGPPTEVDGVLTPNRTEVPNILVRSESLSVRELNEFAVRGITDVSAGFRMRSAYRAEVNPGDEIQLQPSGFEYEILNPPILDKLGVDWLLLTRRIQGS